MDLTLNFQFFKDTYKKALTNPKAFFSETKFDGDQTTSLLIIGVATLLTQILATVRWSGFGPVNMVLSIVVSSALQVGFCFAMAHLLEKTLSFTKCVGRRDQFLRYFMYVSLMGVLTGIGGFIAWGFYGLLGLALLVWSIWGFFQVFKGEVVNVIIVFVGGMFGFAAVSMLVRNIIGL